MSSASTSPVPSDMRPAATALDPNATVAGNAPAFCANCGAPLTGHFCSQCGAPRLDERPLTARRFLSELWNEATNVDSSTVRTFTTLFQRPGALTREYVTGHTRRYMPPLRVYLAMFAVMIFARTAIHADVRIQNELRERIVRQQESSPEMQAIRARRTATHREIPDLATPLSGAIQVTFSNPWLHLVDPLAVALVLTLLYRRRRRNYAEHAVFALHLLAFNCVLIIATTTMRAAWSARMTGTDAVSVLHWLAFGIYAFLALRRVYEESPPRSALKAVALTAGAQAAMLVVPMLTAVAVTMWTVAHLH